MRQAKHISYMLSVAITMVSFKVIAQSNIPIDSPRGAYEGAENIHWYQQKSLNVDDHIGLPPPAGSEFLCNQESLVENCFREPQREPQEAYYIQGRVPVKVAIYVDSRSTSGFDFPYRRAVDAIRRTNDAFSRSGVNAFLYITNVRPFSFDARGYSYDASEIYEYAYSADRNFIESTARDDEADVVMLVRNTQGKRRQSGGLCGYASIGVSRAFDYLTPLVVLTCEDAEGQGAFNSAPIIAPHEFGHVFGLAHEPSADTRLEPHLNFGRPYYDRTRNISTIMATEGTHAPFFSSPYTLYRGNFLGQSDVSDSVEAMNQSAANVALYWERRYGDLVPVDGGGSLAGSRATRTEGPNAGPGALPAPGAD